MRKDKSLRGFRYQPSFDFQIIKPIYPKAGISAELTEMQQASFGSFKKLPLLWVKFLLTLSLPMWLTGRSCVIPSINFSQEYHNSEIHLSKGTFLHPVGLIVGFSFINSSLLDSLVTSKTRIKLLLKFFSNSSNAAYLRALAEEFGESTNSVRVELNRLTDAGLLKAEPAGNTILYKADVSNPIYSEIKRIVSKYLGFDQIIENVLQRIGNLELAVVIGDYAQGNDSGIIDLRLVGDIDINYLQQLIPKAEKIIQRKIRYSIQPKDKDGSGYDFEKQPHILLWST